MQHPRLPFASEHPTARLVNPLKKWWQPSTAPAAIAWAEEEPTATGRVVAIQTRILCDVSRGAS